MFLQQAGERSFKPHPSFMDFSASSWKRDFHLK